MTIGIIVHPYGEAHPAGLERFVRAATHALINASPEHSFVIYSKRPIADGARYPSHQCQFISFNYDWLWVDRTLRRSPQADCYIYWTPVMPIVYARKKNIVFVLDFSYQTMPAHGFKNTFVRTMLHFVHQRSIRKADRVIAISRATKDEIIRLGIRPTSEISVIYPGYTEPSISVGTHALTRSPYILFVGALKERKNVHGIIQGYARIAKEFPELSLLLVGHGGGTYAEKCKNIAQSLGIADKIQFLGQVGDEELGLLYRNATMLAYPSFVEGFGFPILEAMSLGVPVLTSSVGALKEVAEGSAVLVDPLDVASIASGMRSLLTDTQLRMSLVKSGKARVQNFSWEHFARALRDVISTL